MATEPQKDDSMCEENDIEMEQAATIYRQVDPREVQESTWEEWWNMVGGLFTLVLYRVLCRYIRPVYWLICH